MNELYIVMYHYIRDLKHSRYPRIRGLDISRFRNQIRYLKEHFNIVTMEDVLASVRGEFCLPKFAMLLTFDDGYIDHYTYVLPVLEEFKLQGSFFIPGKTFAEHQLLDVNKIHYVLASANIAVLLRDVYERLNYYRGKEYDYPSNDELYYEYGIGNRFDDADTIFVKRMLQHALPEKVRNRIASDLFEKYVGVPEEQLAYELYMTEDQIWTLKRHGMYIGVHGYDHYWLGNLKIEKMHEDIHKALEVMDQFIDKKCWVMNYPYGNYNKHVIEFIESEGACLGLTTKVAVAKIERDSIWELPRLDCNDFPPNSENYKKIRQA